MKIIIAEHSGFCFGVKRAVNLVYKILKNTSKPVYSFGPLIHNPQVVAKLEGMGLKTIKNFDSLEIGKLIIRSHGVRPDVIKEAKERGFDIVDATCPFVRKVQSYARSLKKTGYKVVVLGEPDHPEVLSIIGFAGDDSVVVGKEEDIKCTAFCEKIGIVVQTTFSFENFQSIVGKLLKKGEELRIYNTICKATSVRQNNAIKVAKGVDVMLVVGGKNSANTARLFHICKKIVKDTYWIETADEILHKWFLKRRKVGITAGASTPEWIIQEVVEKLQSH